MNRQQEVENIAVLEQPLIRLLRHRRSRGMPAWARRQGVLTQDEMKGVLVPLRVMMPLCWQRLYGGDLRRYERPRLRINDVDFAVRQ